MFRPRSLVLAVSVPILAIGSYLAGNPSATQPQASTPETQPTPVREQLLLDVGWKFALGDAADVKGDFGYGSGELFAKASSGVGPINPNFNDSSWRTLDLPHD
jgi:hypothetical protein